MNSPLAYVMGIFYIFAGLYHFINAEFYKKMIQNFLPYPLEIIYLSGLIEILLGIAVCISQTRSIASIGIIMLLVAVFPANINMALHPEMWHYSPTMLYLRLPLQGLLIYWAWQYV